MNLDIILNDMHVYCGIMERYKCVVTDISIYEVHRIVRNEIILTNNFAKGDFTDYYAMCRGRIQTGVK